MIRKFAMVTLVLALIVFGATGALVSSSHAASVSNPSSGGGSLQQAYGLGQTITESAAKGGVTIVADPSGSNPFTIDLTPNQGGLAVYVPDLSEGNTNIYGGSIDFDHIDGSTPVVTVNPPTGSQHSIGVNPTDFIFRPQNAALCSGSTCTEGAFAPVTSSAVFLGRPSNGFARLYMDYTNTGTVGNVTINKPAGRVNIGAGLGLVTVTNDNVTTASHIFLNADSAPGNVVAVMFYAVAGSGSFTVNAVPAVTNQTAVDFFVVNAN